MVNLNGHETGNGGYSQGEPKATMSLPYSAIFIEQCVRIVEKQQSKKN
jgi:hypothetical protein